MSASEWFHLECAEVLAETDKAFKVMAKDGDLIWLPKGQLHPDHQEDGDDAHHQVVANLQCNEAPLLHIAIDMQAVPVRRVPQIFEPLAVMRGPQIRYALVMSRHARDIRRGDAAVLLRDAPVLDANLPATVRKTRAVTGHVKPAGGAQCRVDDDAAVVRLARANNEIRRRPHAD